MKRRSATLLLATAALLATVGVQAQDKVPYNLKPGKPYAGTTLRVLLVGTPQFKGLELRADEFTKLTGIRKYQVSALLLTVRTTSSITSIHGALPIHVGS